MRSESLSEMLLRCWNQFHLPQPFLDRRTEFPLDYDRYTLYCLHCCPLVQKWLWRSYCILAVGDSKGWSKQTTPTLLIVPLRERRLESCRRFVWN